MEAQANWNRLLALIQTGVITELNARKLWFCAVAHARDMMLLRPAFNNATITRYESGYQKPPDIAKQIVMPFGTMVIGSMVVTNNPNGAGCMAIYLHALKNSPTCISAFNCDTHHTVVLYSFKPVVTIPELTQEALDSIRDDITRFSDDPHPVSEEADSQIELQPGFGSDEEEMETKKAVVIDENRMRLRSSDDQDQHLLLWIYEEVTPNCGECDGTVAHGEVTHAANTVRLLAINQRYRDDNMCIYQLVDQLADAGSGDVLPSNDGGVRPPKPTDTPRTVRNSDERWIRSDKMFPKIPTLCQKKLTGQLTCKQSWRAVSRMAKQKMLM